jgi:putative ABC transport system permease protein
MTMRGTPILRFGGQVIRAASTLAPGWRRADLRNEWLAELEATASRLHCRGELTTGAQLRLLARCCSAFFLIVWMWKHEWSLDTFTHDLRYGARMLRRRPLFAAVAIGTLALGIGATTAIFSAVHGVLLRPLPYPDPQRLVKVSGIDTRRDGSALLNVSVPDVADFSRLARSFDALGAHNHGGFFTVTGGGEAERVARLLVTSGYFRALGTVPAKGRLFRAEDDRPSPPDVVVISDGFWRRRFGADPGVIGKTLTVIGSSATIVGVLPREFVHPDPALEAPPEIFALLDQDENVSGRGGRYVRAIARLKAGTSLEQAEHELQAIAATLARQYPRNNTGRSVALRPLSTAVTGDIRAPLLMLQGATVAILLIVCANLANLLLAAGTGRTNELAIRTALGAGRTRVMRQLLTEALLLSLAGGPAGAALAWWLTLGLSRAAVLSHVHEGAIAVDATVLLFALALSVAAGLVFGLLPAILVARSAAAPSLRDAPRHTDGPGGHRTRSILVVLEVALSVVLLAGAFLLLRSFSQLTGVDPGFRSRELLSLSLAIPSARYPDEAVPGFYARLSERLRALPGVESVGAISILPFSGGYSCDGFQIVGRIGSEGNQPCAEVRTADTGYFSTMGIRLLAGRQFSETDDGRAPKVIVINEEMARQFFPGESPLGKRIIYSSRKQNDAREIVGVVASVRHFGLSREPASEFYIPQQQPPIYNDTTIVLRVEGDPLAIVPRVRDEVRALEPLAPIYNVRTLDQLIERSVTDARLRTGLLAAFAALAVLLAAIGTYGVMSVAVLQRTREMGIRLALGAARTDLVRMMIIQGLRPTLAGLAVGIAGAVLMSQAIAGLLFQVSPTDPLTFATVPLIIAASGILAAWLPARRACRIDPVIALRTE